MRSSLKYLQIFCFPCLLHHLQTAEHSEWARGSICFDTVTESQPKSAKWFEDGDPEDSAGASQYAMLLTQEASSLSSQIDQSESPQAGSLLHMRLTIRPQITTLALPRSVTWPSESLPRIPRYPLPANRLSALTIHARGTCLYSFRPNYGSRPRLSY